MKRIFTLIAMVVVSLMAMAQTNQLVWANGQLLYATPTDKVDSLTYDASFEGDTLFFIMPHKLVQTVHDTVFVHDTVYEQEIVYVHDTIYINNCEPEEPETTHEYVDLGLSVKWATCNVGATTPEEYGDYFAWGEVEPKTTYDWSTYKYGTNYDQLTKYCSNSSYGKDGFVDNKTVLDPEDDAATANWGGAWRMPTKAEQDELRNNCTWTWTTQNGVNGYKVTGPNGNSIFLPAAGYVNGGTLRSAGSNGYYWSSSLNTDNPNYAYYVSFSSDYVGWLSYNRFYGFSVRPVCK
jgi:hypothetical protein